jgi:hypothetical protein
MGDLAGLAVTWIANGFNAMFNWLTSFWGGTLLPYLTGMPVRIMGALGDVAGAIAAPFESAASRIRGAFEASVASVIPGLQSIINKAQQAAASNGAVGAGGIPGLVNLGAGLMAGGFIGNKPMIYRGHPVFERGLREMVVPLDLPLNRVNKDVRAVAAFARGAKNIAMGGGVISNAPSKVNNINNYITSNHTDPKAAAAHFAAYIGRTL